MESISRWSWPAGSTPAPSCSPLLVPVGWTRGQSLGQPRLHQDMDFVGIEIGTALARDGLTIIPVLIDGAKMPSADVLPERLKGLARRNAIELRNTQFGSDAERLIAAITLAMPGNPKSPVRAGRCWRWRSRVSLWRGEL